MRLSNKVALVTGSALGDQSWEEMMIGIIEIAMPVRVDPCSVLLDLIEPAAQK